ncbi:MAG: DNA mismatch repair endonuclease MutL [Bacteroidia bacterium]
MPDIIQLLPDSVANQIAAGEVIQRPASVVKELLENAVDAGSSAIKLIVKDAGKTLIQIIDNGCGMSETDARMSFERHATSKIRKADDLFALRTKGFRGEALASIGAIAHVELKTKKTEDQTGVSILMEGSEIKKQESCACTDGTSFSVKNLFYNVPARRNFLKTDAVEIRHIIDEFERVALVHPEIYFSFHHNNTEIFNLEKGTFIQRIVAVFGNNYKQRLVAVDEETNYVKIKGYISKPENAKKTRGEQFFFINKRFIKSPYLNHAIQAAYQKLIPTGTFPSYFIMLELDPKTIDINIHPTKTEIKFEDERAVYSILLSVVRQSLGKNNLTPSIDFEQETSFNLLPIPKDKIVIAPEIKVNKQFNPFKTEISYPRNETPLERSNKNNWGKLYENHLVVEQKNVPEKNIFSNEKTDHRLESDKQILGQLHGKYILVSDESGLFIIDQQAAHERVLYEYYLENSQKKILKTQQQLFPQTVQFSVGDFELLKSLQEEMKAMGFDIREFGKNTFIVQGLPTEGITSDCKNFMEELLEQYKHASSELKSDKTENLARAMAKNTAIKSGKILREEEMRGLIDNLFICKTPAFSPSGKPVMMNWSMEELDKKFKK